MTQAGSGRHVHFDLVGGIAGDMTVAALLDAGASWQALTEALTHSGLPAAEVATAREWRGGLAGARFVVAPESDAPHRSWATVRDMLQASRLDDRPLELALAIFERLARAEAQVHGCALDDVHFHEVGALDSIVDIVGTAIALDLLDARSFSCGPVPVCEGSVTGDHGTLPLPAPATAELLVGFRLVPIDGTIETVTPTGAAILATLVPDGGACRPALRLTSTGTGMGSAELPGRANVLRVLVGEPLPAGRGSTAGPGDAVLLEANLDDMDPRLYGEVSANLFAAGALDVTLATLQMKKGRPGTLLSVLCRPELEGVLSGIVLRETTTLGIRSHDVRRTELERRHERVDTAFGPVRIKLGFLGGECVQATPEYADCEAAARTAGVPVKDVLAAAIAAAAPHWPGTGSPTKSPAVDRTEDHR